MIQVILEKLNWITSREPPSGAEAGKYGDINLVKWVLGVRPMYITPTLFILPHAVFERENHFWAEDRFSENIEEEELGLARRAWVQQPRK